MIDPHWQVIDLDPVTWRNLGPLLEPQRYIAAAQPDEHGLFILHDQGRLLKVVDTELDQLDEKALNDKIYAVAGEAGIDTKELFKVMYQALVGKDQGPRLASFLKIIGKQKLLGVLANYR